MKKPAHIAVVAFDRINPFLLASPCVVFGEQHPGLPALDFEVCAAEPLPLRTSAGYAIAPPCGLEGLARADLIIVPSWRDPAETAPAALLDALRAAHARGAVVVGLCLGAYVLAQAGLLDGRRATTHWEAAADFAQRFPAVRFVADVLYVDEGSVVTSAGAAAGIDCCLYLLRRWWGAEVANHVARRLVVAPHRQAQQPQWIEQAVPRSPRTERLAALLDEVRGSLAAPHDLDRMAARAAMSWRSLSRHFRELTGTTFVRWLLAQRLEQAQRLLEGGEDSVDAVAAACGFGSPAALRHHFRGAFGVSPAGWRRTRRPQPAESVRPA